jgi:hypothetical protein
MANALTMYTPTKTCAISLIKALMITMNTLMNGTPAMRFANRRITAQIHMKTFVRMTKNILSAGKETSNYA